MDLTQVKPHVEFNDFTKLDFRVGVVMKAELHPDADKLLKLTVNFGPLGERVICAGIREFYPDLAQLEGKRFAFCVNLVPRKMRGIESHGMILAASNAEHTSLVALEIGQTIDKSGLKSDLTGGEIIG